MKPYDNTTGARNGRNGGSSPPSGARSPVGALGQGDGTRFNSPQDALFTDPRQVIKTAFNIILSHWLAGALAAIFVGAAVGVLIFRFRPIEFTAVTTMLAESPLDQILNEGRTSPSEDRDQENMLTNHLSVLLSRSFRRRLASSFTPAESLEIQRPYLKDGQQPSQSILEAVLAKKIAVAREREQEFFTVTVRHVSAETALMIANRFTASYLDMVQSELHRANQAAAEVLGKQAAVLSSEIIAIEDQRREILRQHNLISAEENQAILDDRIKQVNLARADLSIQRAKLQAEVNRARDDLSKSPLPFANSLLSAYPGTQILRQRLDDLVVQKDVLSIRYGPNHAKMVEVLGGIAAVRDALARNFQLAFSDLRSQLDLAVDSEQGLNAEFDAAFNESLELTRQAGRLNALGQQADGKRKTLNDLFQRIGKAAVDKGLPVDVLRVVDPGYIRRPPVPMAAVYAALIGFFALAAFAGTSLAINFFDERVNENVDFDGKLRLDVIGVVPRLNRTRKEDRPHIVRDNVRLDHSEAFLALASRIELASGKPFARGILVTSTLPGEGKSMLASNLAAAFTRLGRRTVLVDCDFRRPPQRSVPDRGGGAGLLPWAKGGFRMGPELLAPGGPVNASALADGTFHIPAGGRDVQPMRYLSADGMARLFSALREKFEILIVDTPPAGVFQDALVMARLCDDTVFLARDGMANRGQLIRTLQDFAKTAAPPLGIVLNGFSPNTNHPQLYRKYGNYGSAPEAAPSEAA